MRNELDSLKKKQATFKASRSKVFDEISVIDQRIKRKVAELQAAKGKVNFKSPEDVDKHVKDLEKSVESGNLRLAQEKQVLKEISTLKKLRKNFDSFASTQALIDADRTKIAALRTQIDDPESKAINKRFDEIKARLDVIRNESQEASKNRNELIAARSAAQKDVDEVKAKINTLKDEYYGKLRTYNEAIRKEIAERHERERAEKLAAEKERKLRAAEEKLEIASEPAFASQIATAKILISYFDPTYVFPKKTTEFQPAEFGAQTSTRSIELPTGAEVLKKDEESFYAGNGKKKNKNKKKNVEKDSNRLVLDLVLVEQLSSLNVAVPGSQEDVPKTIESLKKKLDHYMENEEAVTKERIAKAKAEIAKMNEEDAKAAEPQANGSESSKEAKTESSEEAEASVDSE